jgi:hypothetical protein
MVDGMIMPGTGALAALGIYDQVNTEKNDDPRG